MISIKIFKCKNKDFHYFFFHFQNTFILIIFVKKYSVVPPMFRVMNWTVLGGQVLLFYYGTFHLFSKYCESSPLFVIWDLTIYTSYSIAAKPEREPRGDLKFRTPNTSKSIENFSSPPNPFNLLRNYHEY